ncbi:TRAM domain-containing protein (plasmid) [Halarchaeum sp. CBA1220]|uniref:TRAM domain-containing protein n=1 Tax=Halarchaeum sp. CBA1220 TaxID=1853682 RepID=UPI000F3A9F7B|nr:TRAM domain-containing protein [Halarchaeum sp. CBA1220]QLC34997.1 TRAM domain-containing protein [Halarchaeum sp. CBA1220]
MAEISDSLRLLFETSIESDGDQYHVQIPHELVENGTLSPGDAYRVALLAADDEGASSATANTTGSASANSRSATAERDTESTSTASSSQQTQRPPVDEGDIRTVTIDTLGDQGDGIAKVERGFIVIVPGTEPGDQLNVEVTDVKETVAFAEPVAASE